MAERIDPPDEPKDPSRAQRFVKGAAIGVAAGTFALVQYADIPSHHDLAEDRGDTPGYAVKDEQSTIPDRKPNAGRQPENQVDRPSAADRIVANASADTSEPKPGMPPGDELIKWRDEDVNELETAIAEDLEKRREED